MRRLQLLALCLMLTGCVTTYRDFPVDALGKPLEPGSCDVLHYNVKRFDILDSGGYNRLNAKFNTSKICHKAISMETAPDQGLFVEVETKWKPMSMPAFIFGYISLSTLTILPSWSTEDGYVIKYNVYVDKQLKETYQYDATRKTGLWLGLLPLAWINWATYDEVDVFDATTAQFSVDSHKYFTMQTH